MANGNEAAPPVDLDELNAQLERLRAAESEIQRAERAGLDVTKQKMELEDLRGKLMRLKNAYFPGR